MSKSIRGVFQKKVSDHWEDIECFHDDRNEYNLQSWLTCGGDRSDTCHFEPLVPIRGLPKDFELVVGQMYSMASGEECNIGEGDFSWLLGSEILQATPPRLVRTVIATPEDFQKFDDPDCPPWQVFIHCYFGHDPGPPDKITTVGENVVYEWLYDFEEDFRYFIDEVRHQVGLHGEVRFVYGFS